MARTIPGPKYYKTRVGQIEEKYYRGISEEKNELWEISQAECQKIDASYIVKMYESIPRRLEAVIQRKGLHTKY